MTDFVKELAGLIKDLLSFLADGARSKSAEMFQRLDLKSRFSRASRILAVLAAALALVSGIASLAGLTRLADFAFFVLELLLAFVVLIALLCLTAAYRLGESFGPSRRLFQAWATATLSFFLAVLGLYWLPKTVPIVFLVFLAAVVFSIFVVRYGIGPSPKQVYVVFVLLIGVSLLHASLVAVFPRTAESVRGALSVLDTRTARSLDTSMKPSPTRIPVTRFEQLTEIEFFDTQGPLVYYSRTRDDGFELFDGPGRHPQTGRELEPIDERTWEEFREWVEVNYQRRLAATPLSAPRRLVFESVDDIEFFDRLTGEPRVWYAILPDRSIDLFSGPGVHPGYQIGLKPISSELVQAIQREEIRTTSREAPDRLQYGSVGEIEFFDRATGEPIVWFAELPDGTIDLFTGPGVDPSYGLQLEPADQGLRQRLESSAARLHEAAVHEAEALANARQEAERSSRQSRYINSSCGDARVGVVAVLGGASDAVFAQQIVGPVGGRADCFRPPFASDGLATQALHGGPAVLRQFDTTALPRFVVVVGLEHSHRVVGPVDRDLERVDVAAQVRIFDTARDMASRASSESAYGVAFSREAAREQALARLRDKIVPIVTEVVGN